MNELSELTISKAQQKLKKKEISSLGLTEAVLKKVKKHNKTLNAYISVFEKEVKEAAKKSDQRRAQGKVLGEVDGIPLAIKDNICIKDTKTLSDTFGLVAALKAVKILTTNGGMGCFASLSFLASEAFTRT